MQEEDKLLVAADDEVVTSIETVDLPRSEGPKGHATSILGKEFTRRDPSNSRQREGRIMCLTVSNGLLSVEDGDGKPSS